MKIKNLEFVRSASKPAQFLKRPIPHFVFAGKSNVGKSSLLNRVLNRKNLARTSQTPGKTRLINYFLVNERFYFVDLPGYGYAKVSKSERQQWGKLIEAYLAQTPYIGMIFQLIDIRHNPGEHDLQMIEWLHYHHAPFRVLLTKADKLAKSKVSGQVHKMAEYLNIPATDLIPTSTISGEGIPRMWHIIEDVYEVSKNTLNQDR